MNDWINSNQTVYKSIYQLLNWTPTQVADLRGWYAGDPNFES